MDHVKIHTGKSTDFSEIYLRSKFVGRGTTGLEKTNSVSELYESLYKEPVPEKSRNGKHWYDEGKATFTAAIRDGGRCTRKYDRKKNVVPHTTKKECDAAGNCEWINYVQ